MRLQKWLTDQRLIWVSGLALIVAGILCLCLSGAVVQGWWQGTLDAFGVGFTVGGVVDVLAISGLNQRVRAEDMRREAFNREAESILQLSSEVSREVRNEAAVSLLKRSKGHLDPWLHSKVWELLGFSDVMKLLVEPETPHQGGGTPPGPRSS